MRFRSLVWALGAGLVFAPAIFAAEYAYTATTVARPNKQGAVSASKINWNCNATGCTTKGPWAEPGVGACRALAVLVGPIRSYGHPGKQLSAADLENCNRGLAGASQMQAQVQAQAKPAQAISPGSSAGVAVNPPGTSLGSKPLAGPNPGLRNSMQLRTEHFDALRRARQKAANELLAAQENELTRRRMAARNKGDDCHDQRRDIHPGAAEICDGYDNDCNGEIDERQTLRRYLDADGDGHGDPNRGSDVCPADISGAARSAESLGGGWLVEVGNDCDDRNPDRWHDCP